MALWKEALILEEEAQVSEVAQGSDLPSMGWSAGSQGFSSGKAETPVPKASEGGSARLEPQGGQPAGVGSTGQLLGSSETPSSQPSPASAQGKQIFEKFTGWSREGRGSGWAVQWHSLGEGAWVSSGHS